MTQTAHPPEAYAKQGDFVAMHEMFHLQRYLHAAIDTLTHHAHLNPHTQRVALSHLIALDTHLKQTIDQLKAKDEP